MLPYTAGATAAASTGERADPTLPAPAPPGSASAANGLPIICMRLALPAFCNSVAEVLERLCDLIGAYYRQIQILSTSDLDEVTRCCYCVWTLHPPTDAMAYQRVSGTFIAKAAAKLTLGAASALLEAAPSAILSDVNAILASLRQHAAEEHPLLRKLGIRTLYVQATATAEFPQSVFTANLVGHPLWEGDVPPPPPALPLLGAAASGGDGDGDDGTASAVLIEPLGVGHLCPTPVLSPTEVTQAVVLDTDEIASGNTWQSGDHGVTWTEKYTQGVVAGSTLNVALRLTRDPTKGSTLRRAKTTQNQGMPVDSSNSNTTATTAAVLAAQEEQMRQRRLAKSLARREKRSLNESLILGTCVHLYVCVCGGVSLYLVSLYLWHAVCGVRYGIY